MSDKAIREIEKAIIREYDHVIHILATHQYRIDKIDYNDWLVLLKHKKKYKCKRRWKGIEFVVVRQKEFTRSVTSHRRHPNKSKFHE
jgi:hypothetical protein